MLALITKITKRHSNIWSGMHMLPMLPITSICQPKDSGDKYGETNCKFKRVKIENDLPCMLWGIISKKPK